MTDNDSDSDFDLNDFTGSPLRDTEESTANLVTNDDICQCLPCRRSRANAMETDVANQTIRDISPIAVRRPPSAMIDPTEMARAQRQMRNRPRQPATAITPATTGIGFGDAMTQYLVHESPPPVQYVGRTVRMSSMGELRRLADNLHPPQVNTLVRQQRDGSINFTMPEGSDDATDILNDLLVSFPDTTIDISPRNDRPTRMENRPVQYGEDIAKRTIEQYCHLVGNQASPEMTNHPVQYGADAERSIREQHRHLANNPPSLQDNPLVRHVVEQYQQLLGDSPAPLTNTVVQRSIGEWMDILASPRNDRPTRMGNLGGAYTDPETGEFHQRVEEVRDNNVATQPAPPVIYDETTQTTYYQRDGVYVPLMIEEPVDARMVHNQIVNAMNNPVGLARNIGTIRARIDVPRVVSPIRQRRNMGDEQLTTEFDTNADIQRYINAPMGTRQPEQLIPTIPTPQTTIPRPNQNPVMVPALPQQGQTRIVPPVIPPVPQMAGELPATIAARQPVTDQMFVPGAPNGRPVLALPTRMPTERIVRVMMPTHARYPIIPQVPMVPNNPMPQIMDNIAQAATAVTRQINNQAPAQVGGTMPMVRIPPLAAAQPLHLTIGNPHQEPTFTPPPLPRENPYINMPRPVVDSIAQERDINLVGTNRERAEQLYEYDHLMPEWIQSVMTKTIDNVQMLTGNKLYVFGALHGVRFENIPGLQNRELVNYIRVSILLNNQNHPGRAILPALVNSLSRQMLEIFAGRLNIPAANLRFIGTADLRSAVTTGRTDHIGNEAINVVARRYTALTTHLHANLLDELYDVNGNDDVWINVARSAAHPLEPVIMGLDTYTPAQIITTFGMAVPLAHAGNLPRYIENNIVSYAKILTRGTLDPLPLDVIPFMQPADIENYVSKLTDNEIFSNIGVYVPYSNRIELVRNTVQSITRPRFMYPTRRTETRCYNVATVINETEITDATVFMVCYGTALKYHMYELDELTRAFNRDDETRAMEFRRPENFRTKFSVQDIEGLRQLLTCFAPTKDITDLMTRIDEGLIDAREKIAFDDTARAQMQRFDKPTCDMIQQYLRQVFATGMYMRRWQGPGYPFPLKNEDTRTQKEPDAKVTEQLGIGIELLKQMGNPARNFCLNLKICEYNGQGNLDHGQATFEGEWDAVIKGTQCIRMASSKFVGTGYHYLRALFRETIPGMDVKAVDRIV